MLKYALLGAAMAMTAPVFAQTAPTTSIDAAMPAQTAPTTAGAMPQTSPAPDSVPADAMQQAPAATPAPTETAAQPAAGADQVASVVDSQFGTYDKDANGRLSATEFGAWMVALKSQSDPAIDADSPATRKWNQAAFAQADKDKSQSLSKAEVTGFLAPAKS